MTATSTQTRREMVFSAHTPERPSSRGTQPLTKEELNGVLRALEIPFGANLVQWRVTEWSEDGTCGLMAYGDPRAYSDRLNSLFTPAVDTQVYGTSQRSGPA